MGGSTSISGRARQDQLRRLAERVGAGEVVFFVGAGFSLDAEGNSAGVLIARLLLRFESLCLGLRKTGNAAQKQLAATLRADLRSTFGLAGARLFGKKLSEHLDKLSLSYYQINDWLCAAFDEVLRELSGHMPPGFEARVRRHEALLLAGMIRHQQWPLRLGELDLDGLLRPFWRHCDRTPLARTERGLAGKVLFLDAMGFNDAAIMSGRPMNQDVQVALRGATGLSERHHALAWLAAEGLCPVVVTTNFDLLLETAYRLAGLLPWNAPASEWPDGEAQLDDGAAIHVPVNQRYSHFARISGAWQFFNHAKAWRAVHLFKIHGCAEAYRSARQLALTPARKGGGFETLRDLLPTIVFTYREIQNWRQDAWSRDHLNTLLRTRTVVFSGYSVADPVIHDTFRNIYEEMAGLRLAARQSEPAPQAHAPRDKAGRLRAMGIERALPGASNDPDRQAQGGADAPAFFMGIGGAEFHGKEILRAASLAAGQRRPDIGGHPNLVTFHLRREQAVPTIDETYMLLYHQCMREVQAKALKSQLLHVYYHLTGKRAPRAEAQAIEAALDELREAEAGEAAAILDGPPGDPLQQRQRLAQHCGWTWHFHRQLMREYALAEGFLRQPAEALSVERLARLPWYCPLTEHADWAAWSVVIELALRRAHFSEPGGQAATAIRPLAHGAPAVDLLMAGGVRGALTLELAAMSRLFHRPLPRSLRALQPIRWELSSQTVPWWREDDAKHPPGTPRAGWLWQWAVAEQAEGSFFGPDGGADAYSNYRKRTDREACA